MCPQKRGCSSKGVKVKVNCLPVPLGTVGMLEQITALRNCKHAHFCTPAYLPAYDAFRLLFVLRSSGFRRGLFHFVQVECAQIVCLGLSCYASNSKTITKTKFRVMFVTSFIRVRVDSTELHGSRMLSRTEKWIKEFKAQVRRSVYVTRRANTPVRERSTLAVLCTQCHQRK